MTASTRLLTIRSPHIGMPRWTRQAGTPVIGSAAANAASVRGDGQGSITAYKLSSSAVTSGANHLTRDPDDGRSD